MDNDNNINNDKNIQGKTMDNDNNMNNNNNVNNDLTKLSIETDYSQYHENLSPRSRDKSELSMDMSIEELELVEIYKGLSPKQQEILLHKLKLDTSIFSDSPIGVSKVHKKRGFKAVIVDIEEGKHLYLCH